MAASALQPSRPHAALVWLIRGTGALIAVCSAIVACLIVAYQFRRTEVEDLPTSILLYTLAFLIVIALGIFVRIGYTMLRKIDANAVAHFSSIFALLLACVWHHFLPPHPPKVIADYCGGNGYRDVLSVIAFLLFYKLIKAYLMQILSSNSPNPSKKTASSAPSAPPDPFDPFKRL